MLIKDIYRIDPPLIFNRAGSLFWPVNAVKGELILSLFILLAFSADWTKAMH